MQVPEGVPPDPRYGSGVPERKQRPPLAGALGILGVPVSVSPRAAAVGGTQRRDTPTEQVTERTWRQGDRRDAWHSHQTEGVTVRGLGDNFPQGRNLLCWMVGLFSFIIIVTFRFQPYLHTLLRPQ